MHKARTFGKPKAATLVTKGKIKKALQRIGALKGPEGHMEEEERCILRHDFWNGKRTPTLQFKSGKASHTMMIRTSVLVFMDNQLWNSASARFFINQCMQSLYQPGDKRLSPIRVFLFYR